MSTEFLDKTGLAYFWSKIKALFNLKADDANVVHKTGNELIEGNKTFSNSNVSSDWDGSSIYIRLPNYDKGIIPDKHYVGNLIFMDKDGTDIDHNGRLGILELAEYPNGINVIRLGVYKNEVTNGVDSDEFSLFGIGYDANGNQYAYCPSTPSLRQAGTDIVTRDWLPKDTRLVHTLVDDVIESVKVIKHTETISNSGHALTSGLLIKVDASKSDSLPSSHKFSSITFIDKNTTSPWIRDSDANRFGAVEHAIRTNGDADIKFVLNLPKLQTTEANGFSSMGLGYDKANDVFYSFLPTLKSLSISSFSSGNYNYMFIDNKTIDISDSAPAAQTINNIILCRDKQGHWFSTLQSGFFSTGEVTTFLTARNYVNGVHTTVQMTLGIDKSGTTWFETPTIRCTNTGSICRSAASSYLSITGADNFGGNAGGKIYLYSATSNHEGNIYIQSTSGSANHHCVFNYNNIVIGQSYLDFEGVARIRVPSGNKDVRIYAGQDNQDGASLQLFGYSATTYAGNFYLRACTKSGSSSTTGSACDLAGSANGTLRWNGQTVQTSSDERLKRDFSPVPDDVLDAWLDVDWLQFRFIADVDRKGDGARLHSGLVAQRVQRAFEARGLDGCAYGILCHELREASDFEEKVVDSPAHADEEGVFYEEVSHMETRHVDAEDSWTVRYAEALSMEAACMRRENARLKKRVSDLEERLAALELRLGSE